MFAVRRTSGLSGGLLALESLKLPSTTRLYSSVRHLGRRPPLRRRTLPKQLAISSSSARNNNLKVAGLRFEQVPTPDMASTMPTNYREMDNTALTTLGAMGNHAALEEMLKRHIMNTDGVSYEEASKVFLEIEKTNHGNEAVLAIPFQLGIITCFAAGMLSIPMVFHLPTVEFFNEHFVTAEHPPTKELETALEVGSWSWNWMEPVMGTSTFLLLTMQYMRMHLQYLGVAPYAKNMKRMRARRLVNAFPQYNENLLYAYSESAPMYNPKDLWI